MTIALPLPPPYSPPNQAANHAMLGLQSVEAPSSAAPIYQDSIAPVASALLDDSAASAKLEGRDARGRFSAGNSGRPKGARSRLVTELEQAMELAAPEIVRVLIGRAQCGDGSMEAAKYILERIAPSRRSRLIEIEGFPDIRTPADVPDALASLASAIGNGVATIEEGTAIARLLHTFLETYESANRLTRGPLLPKTGEP